MRRAELTANGVDIALYNKADAVRLLGVEVEPDQLAMLQELRDGCVVVEIQGARICVHRKCRLSLADDGGNTLKLEVAGSLEPGEIEAMRPLQRQAHLEEIAAVTAGMGPKPDPDDLAEAIDDLLRFDVAVSPMQLAPEDVVREGLEEMKAAAEADGIGVTIEARGKKVVLAEPRPGGKT